MPKQMWISNQKVGITKIFNCINHPATDSFPVLVTEIIVGEI
ncbi:hypothetical protein Hdeb2414_s0003g00118181 [Helianthus debilis subsp. tardiflorus]